MKTIKKKKENGNGFYVFTEGEWKDLDGFHIIPEDSVISEETHHQGICFFSHNRLLSVAVSPDNYRFAVSETPTITGNHITVNLSPVRDWKMKGSMPDDVPVLPDTDNHFIHADMTPYSKTAVRITMFPRMKAACLK